MKLVRFDHTWQCAGCGTVCDLVTHVEEAVIKRAFNPAPIIANEKLTTAKKAAVEHASRCSRPV